MDVQNAVEPASTKPPGASLKRSGPDADQLPRPPSLAKPVASLKPNGPSSKEPPPRPSSTKDPRKHARDRDAQATAGAGGAAPSALQANDADCVAGAEGSSDAETIVLPGKDGHSPSKPPRVIQHDGKSDGEARPSLSGGRKPSNTASTGSNGDGGNAAATGTGTGTGSGKRMRPDHDDDRGDRSERGDKGERAGKGERAEKSDGRGNSKANVSCFGPASAPATGVGATDAAATSAPPPSKKPRLPDKSRPKDASSGLSSAPASPPHPHRLRRSSHPHPSSHAHHSPSDSESETRHRGTKERERPPSLEHAVSHKRKAALAESDDEGEVRKIRRQRTSGSGLNASRKQSTAVVTTFPAPHSNAPSEKPLAEKSSPDKHPIARVRSTSPHSQPQPRRRSISSHIPSTNSNHVNSNTNTSSNGLGHKKRHLPAPLTTDYHSDDSSGSSSPHPRSSKLRGLGTPAPESNTSPAKMAPHKKHLDAHGQTFLARACAKGEFEAAKQRLKERPEDIDVADYAGNTPLQIAALNGYLDIVKLLVQNGCNLECVNNDKDTPLLDAVENDHIEVVRTLLDAGVNPRKANAYGQEPMDRIQTDGDNAHEIRRILQEAKDRTKERRRPSEEHHLEPLEHADGRSPHGAESPQRDPSVTSAYAAAASGRKATARATKTSNHQLYMPMDDKTLRAAAARGDSETVLRILQVRDKFDDPESMVSAARGGHDTVMEFLLALGKCNPDPPPIGNGGEFCTPILAAIGQENIAVIKLLLEQANFNPARRYGGETYFEIARRRRGPNCVEEERILKEAYDKARKSLKDKSPRRRDQDRERDPRRSVVDTKEQQQPSKEEGLKPVKKKTSNPAAEPKKTGPAKTSSSSAPPKVDKIRTDSATGGGVSHQDDDPSPKRGPGRPKKEERLSNLAVSDREASPATRRPTKPKRTDPDAATMSSEGEAAKRRRKLVSGRELKGEHQRDKQRRSSMTSTASIREISSPREEPEKQHKVDKQLDRTKALKRDEPRERMSGPGDSGGKRHRASATPPSHSSLVDKDPAEAPIKRRRLESGEGREKEKRLTQPSSLAAEERRHKSPARARDSANGTAAPVKVGRSDIRDGGDLRTNSNKPSKPKKPESLLAEQERRDSAKPPPVPAAAPSTVIKAEDVDVEMTDAPPAADKAGENLARAQRDREKEDMKSQAVKPAELDRQTQQPRAKQRETEDRKRKEEEQGREHLRQEDEEKQRRNKEERLERIRRLHEDDRRRTEEEDRQQREREEREQELKRQVEEERRKLEKEARRQKEEAEQRQRKEVEERERIMIAEAARKEKEAREKEARRKREEEEQRRREEEERQQEQRRREEEEQRRREVEEQRKREEEERRERARREEEERLEALRKAERAALEAERQRLEAEQKERERQAGLPPMIRWWEVCPDRKCRDYATSWFAIRGIRLDCLDPMAEGTPSGKELWVNNVQVAVVLGEDLALSRYPNWRRTPSTRNSRIRLWALENGKHSMTGPAWRRFGHIVLDLFEGQYEADDNYLPPLVDQKVHNESRLKLYNYANMFFVKVSDFLAAVGSEAHLRDLQLGVEYHECLGPDVEWSGEVEMEWRKNLKNGGKWKPDPELNTNLGFAPATLYYVNGQQVGGNFARRSITSHYPFPDKPRPKRGGLTTVHPGEPDYERLCKEQGLEHLLQNTSVPASANSINSSPVVSGLPNGHGSSSSVDHSSPTSLLPPTSVPASNGTGRSSSQNQEQQRLPDTSAADLKVQNPAMVNGKHAKHSRNH